ncbi:phosphoglycerate dehydrogenase [Amphiplicatus metriothermophilus]|uniref:D-3-phosphoglycerate dehydrogenase n=1 Tax=Amphiplicatus metriothermophilus TaxID=1519374 RepID=A0A239PYG7_9PROT|nr:phosphoglycerate dehydrogenase [Amphiplicatus metriothermophilus]MBB5518187.1 D-3-phosphoglycerate dehydrogenase [Amphiplicatus metriothermophilus]SNT75349.1 D-3-phosphoglycerate dehydrogenase [Amphiplicatus metriothermophilus]
MPKVLISDALSETAVQIFRARGIDVEYAPELGKDRDRLIAAIGEFDGLAVRSATKASAPVIKAGKNLKVIGRAGIGVDNIDLPAATAAGVVVMNTPYGNAITTAEHAIALMFALARQIPQANESTHAGRWEKNRFMGVELYGKTLGIIGCGNIGSIVADRAIGMKMHVIAYDPFLTDGRAVELGVEKVELDELLKRADIISLHAPLTEQTRNILSAENIARTKKGVFIVNCARGGLIDEDALKDALDSGHVAGAGLDVFAVEPANEHPLFGHERVVATPHLGASTREAQENVAIQIAEQMADFLLRGAVTNALNMPSITAEEAPKLRPYIKLAENLGLFAGQLTETSIRAIEVVYAGAAAKLNTRPLTAAAVAGVLKPILSEVNVVNAPVIAKERGVAIAETYRDDAENFESVIRLRIVTERQDRAAAGALFGATPRIVNIKGVEMEAGFAPHMLYVTNEDKPGFIGALGQTLGAAGVNIATFNLGRSAPGADAIALIAVDEPVSEAVLARVRALPHVKQAKPLTFNGW